MSKGGVSELSLLPILSFPRSLRVGGLQWKRNKKNNGQNRSKKVMGSGLGLGDRRWGLSFCSPESWESTNHCREQDRRATWRPGEGFVPGDSGHPGPGTSSRERPGVAEEGKTASLGESRLVLVTAQLLIVGEKHGFWFIHQPCELG